MAKLMLHRNIFKNFRKLPVQVQKKIPELVAQFEKNPTDPSINLHSLKNEMRDPKVHGAKLPDGYRAVIIAPDKGDTYLLMHVDSHDEAYAWAKNKQFEVHPNTGVFQMFDVEEIERELPTQSLESISEPGYPLAQLSDEDFFTIGVPRPLIPAVRAIKSDEALERLVEYLPPDCRDVLYGIASGMTLEQTLDEMLSVTKDETLVSQPTSTGDFTQIEKSPNFDLVLFEGEEHLKEILSKPLEVWRLFLHPYQRKLVQWKTNGPMNINGAAGTGKTVALMHRAVYLARNLSNPKDKVLVTTYSTNLSITIKRYLQGLGPDVFNRLEVTNLHALSRTICRRAGWNGRIATEDEEAAIWEEVLVPIEFESMPMSKNDVKKEYQLIVDANGIDSLEAYLTTIRSGRPRISRQQKKDLWPIFSRYQSELKKRNLLTFEGAIHQARLSVERKIHEGYRHVLVDEVQDFSLEALRLICALSPIDQELTDPLCTVGDGHQRIYRTKIPMSRAGINIRGRSRRLKINYRTSEQIRKFAQSILMGVEIDDLDGSTVKTDGDHSAFSGPEPEFVHCADITDEAMKILEWIKNLTSTPNGLKTYEICITPFKSEVKRTLVSSGIQVHELRPKEDDPTDDIPGVRMGSMKRIKGLEYRAIAMACADPEDPMNAPETHEIQDRCERYVAATRAREFLLVTLAKKN